jgi:uncharacterized membrane protein YeaQ/YmgE (transglycosylase-associated protein family)
MIYAIIIGAIAGWLAGKVMKGGGFGFLKNMILGIIGGLVGSWVFDVIGITIIDGILGDIAEGFIGAVIILAIAGAINKNKG